MKEKLTEFRNLRVVDSEGANLGRIWELRCEVGTLKSPEKCRVIDVVYGTSGLLERLGLKRRKLKKVAWNAIVSADGQELVVGH